MPPQYPSQLNGKVGCQVEKGQCYQCYTTCKRVQTSSSTIYLLKRQAGGFQTRTLSCSPEESEFCSMARARVSVWGEVSRKSTFKGTRISWQCIQCQAQPPLLVWPLYLFIYSMTSEVVLVNGYLQPWASPSSTAQVNDWAGLRMAGPGQ